MKPTDEQAAILSASGERIRVRALAGTGKTTTLRLLAEANPDSRILYLAFNRSVAQAVKHSFPGNVDARTTHSLALASFPRRFRYRVGDIAPWDLEKLLDPPYSLPATRTRFTRYVRETLDAWCHSSVSHLSAKLLPGALRKPPKERDPLDQPISAEDVLQCAWRLLDRMKDPRDESVPVPHDAYLKLWSLKKPQLDSYDMVLLDEAQDANPAVLSVIQAQRGRRVVFVGDAAQAIYGWRGAVNAMEAPADETFHLTGSFRFGPEIASVGDAVLKWIDPKSATLRGLGAPGMVGRLAKGHQMAVLGRTNEGLFDMAAKLVTARPRARLGFVGGYAAYGFDTILDVYRLWAANETPVTPEIARFPHFEALKDYADHSGDVRLKIRARVVETYGTKIPQILGALRAADRGGRAPYLFSTVHRAKGGEWPQVVMADDFVEMTDAGGQPVALQALVTAARPAQRAAVLEHARLRYVAVTRAQRYLQPDAECRLYLTLTEDHRAA